MARMPQSAPDPTTYPDVQAKAARAERAEDDRRWVSQAVRGGRTLYGKASDQVGEGAEWLSAQVEEFTEARPFVSLAAGLAAGVAMGFLIGLLVWDDA